MITLNINIKMNYNIINNRIIITMNCIVQKFWQDIGRTGKLSVLLSKFLLNFIVFMLLAANKS